MAASSDPHRTHGRSCRNAVRMHRQGSNGLDGPMIRCRNSENSIKNVSARSYRRISLALVLADTGWLTLVPDEHGPQPAL